MTSGSYERMMARKSKEDLGTAIHDLLSDHFPETYYGRGGRQESFCRTCMTSSEDYESEYHDSGRVACNVMETLESFVY